MRLPRLISTLAIAAVLSGAAVAGLHGHALPGIHAAETVLHVGGDAAHGATDDGCAACRLAHSPAPALQLQVLAAALQPSARLDASATAPLPAVLRGPCTGRAPPRIA